MFHRRRASNPALNNPPPSASAATAAAQAFLNNRASNGSLSAAAAAAALRSHTTSPVPVGSVQTKRTIRRQNSAASNGSGGSSVVGPGGRGLQRQSSSGSMSERTFREPSPNRGPVRERVHDAPPVPALPTIPPSAGSAHRRAASLDPPGRITSPAPTRGSGRGVSLDRGPGPSSAGRIAAQRVTSLTSVQEMELERAGSPGSVNFSRPTGVRSPLPSSPTASGRPGSPVANNMAPTNGLLGAQAGTQQALPPKKKKKKKNVVPQENTQTTPTVGAVAAPPQEVAPLLAQAGSIDNQPATSTVPKKKKKKVARPTVEVQDQNLAGPSQGSTFYNSDLESIAESGDDASATRPPRPRNAGLLVKQPSLVREDREQEERGDLAPATIPTSPTVTAPAKKKKKKKVVSQGSNQVTSDTLANSQPQGQGTATASASKRYAETRQLARSASQPVSPPAKAFLDTTNTGDSTDLPVNRGTGSLRARPQSLSPARVAHFSSNPPITSPNIAKHQPPPRSLSPAKSAMKQSPSPLGGSPSVQTSGRRRPTSFHAPSEASDTSMISDEGMGGTSQSRRKKSARVSFDEEPVVVMNGASPPQSPVAPQLMSPQHMNFPGRLSGPARDRFHGSGVESGTFLGDNDDDDDVLKPRPALPSFGSVRNRKDRDNSQESTGPSLRGTGTAPATANTSVSRDNINASSDQAVGQVIAQEMASKTGDSAHAGADSSSGGEAGLQGILHSLPPQVTTVDGTGFGSDSESESNYSTEGSERKASGAKAAALKHKVDPADVALPSIELIGPTPTLEQTEATKEWLSGTHEASAGSESTETDDQPVAHHRTEPTPASVGIAEPEPEESAHNHTPGLPVVGEVAETLRHQSESHDEDETEDDTVAEVYIDAAEDQADLEGDGFLSIDAVVESPVVDNTTPGLAVTTPPASPTARSSGKGIRQPSKLGRKDSDPPEPAAEEGWDKAQAYWSSLSDQKKEQIEQAALPEGESKSADEPKTTVRKKKKKVRSKSATSPPDAPRNDAVGTSDDAKLPPWPDQAYQKASNNGKASIAKGPKTTTISTAGATDPEKRLPKTMRSGPTATSGPEVNGARSNGATVGKVHKSTSSKVRPQSAPVGATRANISEAVQRELQNMPTPVSPPAGVLGSSRKKKPAKPLGRVASTGSDSSASASSFRKQRRPQSSSGAFTMRTTMRGTSLPANGPNNRRIGSPDSFAEGARSSRFSIRSLSPTGSGFRKSTGTPSPSTNLGKGTMRTSLRGSADVGRTSLRASPSDRTKSPSRFSGFGRSSKSKAAPAKKSRSRPTSRFADSSDDDDVRPTFRSRFSDSSDEGDGDIAALTTPSSKFTPVRGIPRRVGERDGESTDLDDSSEEGTPSKQPKGGKNALPTLTLPDHPQEGTALASGTLRPSSGAGPNRATGPSSAPTTPATQKSTGKKKRSFFGVLGRRKDSTRAIQKPEGESGARRDTPLERSAAEIQSTRFVGVPQQQPAPPSPITPEPSVSRPKLLKKVTQRSYTSATNWPLIPAPPPIPKDVRPGDTPVRPSTSDGVTGAPRGGGMNGRPLLGDRRSTGTTAALGFGSYGKTKPTVPVGLESPVVTGGTGSPAKKKKFPRLRRAFGLHD